MNGASKVVILNTEFYNFNLEKEVFSELGNVELIKAESNSEVETIKLTKNADAIINHHGNISKKVIDKLDKCKVISTYGIGTDRIEIEAATKRGICVSNVPDYCLDEVSDHALALLLSWGRKIVLLNSIVKQNQWDFQKAIPIHRFKKQNVGILGFGNIPRILIKKLLAIGFKVLVFDPYVSQQDIKELNANSVSLEEVFRMSDFISIHLPLTNETDGLVNKNLLYSAKENLVIINTSRGEVINENDLIESLESGKIAGAALDVISEEPVNPDNPLLKMNNVILTPHSAWYSEEALYELRSKCANNVLQALKGFVPKYLINKKVISKTKLKR